MATLNESGKFNLVKLIIGSITFNVGRLIALFMLLCYGSILTTIVLLPAHLILGWIGVDDTEIMRYGFFIVTGIGAFIIYKWGVSIGWGSSTKS